jgi:hypothetical protein
MQIRAIITFHIRYMDTVNQSIKPQFPKLLYIFVCLNADPHHHEKDPNLILDYPLVFHPVEERMQDWCTRILVQAKILLDITNGKTLVITKIIFCLQFGPKQ